LQRLHPTCEESVRVRGLRRPAAGCGLSRKNIAFQYRDLAEVERENPGCGKTGHSGPEHNGMISQ
jgi:hypothetical protein